MHFCRETGQHNRRLRSRAFAARSAAAMANPPSPHLQCHSIARATQYGSPDESARSRLQGTGRRFQDIAISNFEMHPQLPPCFLVSPEVAQDGVNTQSNRWPHPHNNPATNRHHALCVHAAMMESMAIYTQWQYEMPNAIQFPIPTHPKWHRHPSGPRWHMLSFHVLHLSAVCRLNETFPVLGLSTVRLAMIALLGVFSSVIL